MPPIPRYRPTVAPALLSAGFRPFFLLAALWAAIAVPLWLVLFAGEARLATMLAPTVWHVHEMAYGYGAAVIAGFLLTAIPNWTGRMPLQGGPLALLVAAWLAGRLAVLSSAVIGPAAAAVADLSFPVLFLVAVTREILAGRNWRNLPMPAALASLLAGNALVHAEALGLADTAAVGDRIGVAVLLMLIGFIGGRIVPSFTRNWLARERPGVAPPAPFDGFDRAVLALTGLTLLTWVFAGDAPFAPWIELVGGLAVVARLARWQGQATAREPLLWVLHVAYAWLGLGLLLLSWNGISPVVPETTALHALTVGAIGTMTLAVMTRATLGHTGQKLTAGPGTVAIHALVTLAAVARLAAPLAGAYYLATLTISGAAWSAAFGLFVWVHGRLLTRPRRGR